LQRDHKVVAIQEDSVQVDQADRVGLDQVAQVAELLTVRKVQVHPVAHQVVHHLIAVAEVVVEMPAALSVKVAVRRSHRRVRKRYVMILKIWRRQILVAQWFHEAMAQLKLSYVAVQR
jgi:hypothetical protein